MKINWYKLEGAVPSLFERQFDDPILTIDVEGNDYIVRPVTNYSYERFSPRWINISSDNEYGYIKSGIEIILNKIIEEGLSYGITNGSFLGCIGHYGLEKIPYRLRNDPLNEKFIYTVDIGIAYSAKEDFSFGGIFDKSTIKITEADWLPFDLPKELII